MKEQIPNLTIELLNNGNLRLADDCYSDQAIVEVHPVQVRLMAERLGLVRQVSASEADALRKVDKLARRIRVLHGRIAQMQKWFNADHVDLECYDMTVEYWFNEATLDLASEFVREIEESGAGNAGATLGALPEPSGNREKTQWVSGASPASVPRDSTGTAPEQMEFAA